MTLTPEELDTWVHAHIVGVHPDLHRPTVARAALAASIDPMSAFEAYNRVDAHRTAVRAAAEEKARRPRLPSATRWGRAENREPLPGTMYAPATALEVLNDPLLSANARILLLHIRALAGRGRILETLTVSLATLLGCSRRAVQVWRRELVDAGLVVHRYDPQRGIVVFEVTDLVEPTVPVAPPRRVRTPEPDMRFKVRWANRMARLREAGRAVLRGGANQATHIKGLEISISKSVMAT